MTEGLSSMISHRKQPALSEAASKSTDAPPSRRPSPWWIACAILCLLCFAFDGDVLFLKALLSRSEAPIKSELIVVFSGGGGDRFRHAIALLRAGYANKILFVGTQAEMEFARAVVTHEDASAAGQMVFVRPNVANTFASARFLRDYVIGEHYERIILVSNRYHGFRMELSFSKLLHGNRFHRLYCPTKEDPSKGSSRKELWLEAVKSIWYVLRY